MKSSDLILFKNICNKINPDLYSNLQNPNNEFIEEIEKNIFFENLNHKYDFNELEKILDVNLRYYQKLAIYFSKYYLENEYYENNKLAYWMATGSGKTLIMKANIIDYLEYLRDKNPSQVEIIITSPMSELINQLNKEMKEFFHNEFFNDFNIDYKIDTTQSLINLYKRESPEIIGDSFFRLLLVDEAHIGLQSKSEKSAFVKLRNNLTKNIKNSFMFEYSATFYDVKKEEQTEYANRIIFEYDYSKFFNDKYGKDFKFDIVQKDEIANDNEEINFNLNKNIDAFTKKIYAFINYNKKYPTKPFKDKPLLVMAGNTVSSSNNEENSDIAKVVNYFAKLKKRDENLFYNSNEAVLYLIENSEADGELLLKYGENSTPFGLITIGNIKSFLENKIIQELIKENKLIYKKEKFLNEEYRFENIDNKNSPINILIGSRKFSAGWNSFRVSQICLINFGTSNGPTIIQMFGRGVRLKGLNEDGKRSVFEYVISKNDNVKTEFKKWDRNIEIDEQQYEYLKYLETLFVFSLRKTYLEEFIKNATSILYKTKIIERKTKINENIKNKELPIFYLEKEKFSIDNLLLKLEIKDTISIKYKNKKTELKNIFINLNIEKPNILKIEDIEYLKDYIDLSYVNYIINKEKNFKIENFDVDLIISLIKKGIVKIYYDNEIKNPIQFQKMIIKVAKELKNKIKNKIIYEETKNNYKLSTVKQEDLIDKYEIRVTFDREAKQIEKALEKIDADSFKDFLYHYFIPLAIDLKDKIKEETIHYYQKIENNITINYSNIVEFINEEFENEIQDVRITPDKLNGYELKFLYDLEEYVKKTKKEIKILRNKSKNNIGINIEDGIFYPDFIIWYQENKVTHIIFCDPKGITRPETLNKVLNTPYEIKKLEKLFKKNIKLHYFTISNSHKEDVTWSPIKDLSIDECDNFYNLVFMNDDKNYIDRIFKGIEFDITLHKDFIKHINEFDKITRKEWLDEKKRNYHLKIIEQIQKEENLDFEKAMLLYFVIYEKRNIIEEKLKNEVLDDLKQLSIEQLLEELGISILSDFIPMGNTAFKIIKLSKHLIGKFKNK